MSEGGIGDLSKIVSLIMENPKLIEEISNLAKGGTSSESEAPKAVESTPVAVTPSDTPVVSSAPTALGSVTSSRSRLLGALKPYVSAGRASAIDSMLSIADILEMMKAR